MIRSELFSLLCISESSKFVSGKKEMRMLKQGVFKYLETKQQMSSDDINNRIMGWNKFLYDKMNENYKTDV